MRMKMKILKRLAMKLKETNSIKERTTRPDRLIKPCTASQALVSTHILRWQELDK